MEFLELISRKKYVDAKDELEQKFQSIAEKYCDNTTFSEYLDFNNIDSNLCYSNVQGKKLYLVNDLQAKFNTRWNFVDTLAEIKYERGDNKWTPIVVVAFLQECISVFTEPYLYASTRGINIKEISKRYNVAENRLKTQMALFINNLINDKDKFNLLEYFDIHELYAWKYRDDDYLLDALENKKLTKEEEQIIIDLKK